MSGERFRLIYGQSGREHTSSVVLSEDEVCDHLEVEAVLHEKTGWVVTRGERLLICRRGNSLRSIEAKRFDPFDDVLS